LDPDVRAALAAPGDEDRRARLNRKLARVSIEADTRALYLIGPDGRVFASDDYQMADTHVVPNLADRPCSDGAVASGRSNSVGVEPERYRVLYCLAEAVDDASSMLGIAVVRMEFDALEAAWGRAAERVLVTDSDGVVFLASDPRYKYRFI